MSAIQHGALPAGYSMGSSNPPLALVPIPMDPTTDNLHAKIAFGLEWFEGMSGERKEALFKNGVSVMIPLMKSPKFHDNRDAFLIIEAIIKVLQQIPKINKMDISIPNTLTFLLSRIPELLYQVFEHTKPAKLKLIIGALEEEAYSDIRRGIYGGEAIWELAKLDYWFGFEGIVKHSGVVGGGDRRVMCTWVTDGDDDDGGSESESGGPGGGSVNGDSSEAVSSTGAAIEGLSIH